MNYFYDGVWRLDWGFENPNRTAALIALLMVLSWLFAWHRRGFWLSLFLFTGLAVCLLHTFSRGGFLAASLGCGALLWWVPRPWPRRRVWSVVVVLAGLGIYASVLGAAERYATAWQGDLSVLNRLEIWKFVPRMMLDAPEGWGLGQSQNAYMNWYQPPNRTEAYINLVSTHLTLLAEISWPLRILYIGMWALAFVLTWPGRRCRMLNIPFGMLVAFFVAAIFTHMGPAWPIYGLAVLAALAGLVVRIYGREWPTKRHWAIAATAALAILTILALAGVVTPAYPVTGTAHRVMVGKAPAYWIVENRETLGREFGKTYRRLIQADAASTGFAKSLAQVPARPPVLVLAGLDAPSLPALAEVAPFRLILLNPICYPGELPPVLANTPTLVVFGEFSRSPSQMAWREKQARVVPGVGDFFPDWPLTLRDLLSQQ